MKSKSAFSEVIAMMLLLVLLVSSIVIMQVWYVDFSSSVQVETKSHSNTMETGIDQVVGTVLYFNNKYESLTITDISVAGNPCGITAELSKGVSSHDISSCMGLVETKTPIVVVYTNKGIYTGDFFYNR